MGKPGGRDVSRIHSLFADDWKMYKESHETQASHDTGTCYGVLKCAEIMFERGKMVRGEALEVLEERMKTMDPDNNEIFKFLGIERVDRIKTKKVFEQVKDEVNKRVKMLINTELNDVNLVRAVNTKVIQVIFNKLKELNQVIKCELRSKNMLGKQSSDERLHLRREDSGRGIKSLKNIYKETRLRVACYVWPGQKTSGSALLGKERTPRRRIL